LCESYFDREISAGEPRWLRGPIGRPLEPDAGNAAEGRSELSHAIFRAWLFVEMENNLETRRPGENFWVSFCFMDSWLPDSPFLL
jgi:hypothetical protein